MNESQMNEPERGGDRMNENDRIWRGESLIGAIYHKDYKKMKKLIEEGADVNYIQERSTTPLRQALVKNDCEAFQILAEREELLLNEDDERMARHLIMEEEMEPELQELLKNRFPCQMTPEPPAVTLKEFVRRSDLAGLKGFLSGDRNAGEQSQLLNSRSQFLYLTSEILPPIRESLDKAKKVYLEARRMSEVHFSYFEEYISPYEDPKFQKYQNIALALLNSFPLTQLPFEYYLSIIEEFVDTRTGLKVCDRWDTVKDEMEGIDGDKTYDRWNTMKDERRTPRIEFLDMLKAQGVRWEMLSTEELTGESHGNYDHPVDWIVSLALRSRNLSILDYALEAGADLSALDCLENLKSVQLLILLEEKAFPFMDGLFERGLNPDFFGGCDSQNKRFVDVMVNEEPCLRPYFESRGYVIRPIIRGGGLVPFEMKKY